MKTKTRFLKPIAIYFLVLINWSCSNQNQGLPTELASVASQLPDEIDYNLHVKPILSDRCFKCHGPDKSKVEAGLQLTNFDAATMQLKSGFRAIEPGNSTESELVKRILSHDAEDIMPTPKSNLALNDLEKAILVKWIQQGGEYKEHWAFSKIEKPSVPKIGTFWSRLGLSSDPETDWAKNEIDAFVLDKGKKNGLKTSKEADKATLLRRVSMDLTGLPPSPEEVDAFLKDNAPNAYEKAVDKLLKSPHYGENQAVSWLDAARYADTQGYQDDGMRNAFPYRDWVIKAFNQNLSLDNFVKYQLAGDLMPNPSTDMLVATSFNRQHQQSQEGGIVPKEYKVEYVADRVNTFGKTFLGLTTECARCHDHKYDPISAKDYYSLFAFFNTNNEFGQIPYNGEPSPHITLPKPESQQKLNAIKSFVSKLKIDDEASLKTRFEQWLKAAKQNPQRAVLPDSQGLVMKYSFEKIETNKRIVENKIPADAKKKTKERVEKKTVTDHILANTAQQKYFFTLTGDSADYPKIIKGKYGNAIQLMGGSSAEMYGGFEIWTGKKLARNQLQNIAFFERYDPFTINVWINIDKIDFAGSILNRNGAMFNGYRGYNLIRTEKGNLAFRFAYAWPDDAIDVETALPFPTKKWVNVSIAYDGSSKAAGMQIYIDGQPVKTLIKSDNLQQSTIYGKNFSWWGSGTSNFAFGQLADQAYKGYAVDELYVLKRKLSQPEIQGLMLQQNQIGHLIKKQTLSETEKQGLLDYYKTNFDANYTHFLTERSRLIEQETDILVEETVDVAIMQEQKIPQKSFLLKRGAYDAESEELSPAPPAKFGKMATNFPKNRLGLAEWLLDEDNPLFARVMVNRFWQNYFGMGLVKTQEDFGNQGDMPTNAALLDWLSVKFREMNWDVKAFQKLIVMSATYRQSSMATQAEIEKDPENKMLMRGPSFRYSAEQVRDNALAASGLLNQKIGGPSVYPYQPAGIWEALATRNAVTYTQNHGDSLYRRSLYTIWKRSSPPPMMLNFDAAERHTCVVRRQKTATPLQALVTMNDPQFIEAAKILAEKSLILNKNEVAASINYIFKAALSRPARKHEMSLMTELYDAEYQDFMNQKERVSNLLQNGERKILKAENETKLAALIIVANTVLNYDEAIVKR
jgi:Protein of unknown function (DUF1553)/Protein of unknown function (DUF1549)/Planctomycete cytochrome C/Concanavalin A-like lectin/glucanases superfamily